MNVGLLHERQTARLHMSSSTRPTTMETLGPGLRPVKFAPRTSRLCVFDDREQVPGADSNLGADAERAE